MVSQTDARAEWYYRKGSRQYAKQMLNCPYLKESKSCITGCWQEPKCITDEPLEGWENYGRTQSCDLHHD